MAGRGPGRDPRQRLGSLSADKGEKAGRLGALRTGGPGAAAGSDRAAGSAGAAPSGEASGSAPAPKAKPKFAPRVPTARKKKDPAAAVAGAGPSVQEAGGSGGGEDFKALIQHAQSDASWRASRRQRGGRGFDRFANQAPAEVVFGGGVVKSEAKSDGYKTGFGAGGSGGGGSGKGSGGRGSKKGGKGGATTVRRTGPGGAVDSAEAYESEDEAPEGSLNYRQYYPTMLPFLPPEEEAALQGVQQQQAFQPDAPVQVHDDGASVAGYMQLEDSPEDAEQLMLFQLPPLVPAHNRHRKLPAIGALQLKDAEEDEPPPKSLPIELVPGGRLGKMRVYRSGKVKLRLGDVVFDMAQGIPSEIRQDAVVINTTSKDGGDGLLLGDIEKRLVCTPDVSALLEL